MSEIFPGTPITSLPEAVTFMGALPMKVGTEPVDADRAKAPWGRGEDGRPLLGPGAHWTDVPEVVDQELARIQGRVDQAQSGHWYVASDTEAWRPAGTVRTNVDGYQRTVGRVTNMRPADLDLVLHAHDDLSWCLDMITKLRAQVAELNEPVSTAAEALRESRLAEESSGGFPPALPWLALMDEDDRVEFLDELADSATVNASSAVRLAEIERTCATYRLIAEAQHGHNTAPGPDAMSQAFAPVAALRELSSREEPHDSPLHHSYLTGHDLDMPEAGGDGRD